MQFYFHANQSHFHKNSFALRLALKQGHKETRKWPIPSGRGARWESWAGSCVHHPIQQDHDYNYHDSLRAFLIVGTGLFWSRKSLVSVTRAGVFIWENMHLSYLDLGPASHMNTSLICCLEKVISETELVWLTGLMRKGPDSARAALWENEKRSKMFQYINSFLSDLHPMRLSMAFHLPLSLSYKKWLPPTGGEGKVFSR